MRLTLACSVVVALLVSPESAAFSIDRGSLAMPRFLTTRPTSTSTSTALNAEGSTITMPALSSTMKEGRVVSWLKQEGDAISAGEAIMVVESDKADVSIGRGQSKYLLQAAFAFNIIFLLPQSPLALGMTFLC